MDKPKHYDYYLEFCKGLSLKDIAKKFKLNEASLRVWCSTEKWKQSRESGIGEVEQKKFSVAELGRKFSVPESTVGYWVENGMSTNDGWSAATWLVNFFRREKEKPDADAEARIKEAKAGQEEIKLAAMKENVYPRSVIVAEMRQILLTLKGSQRTIGKDFIFEVMERESEKIKLLHKFQQMLSETYVFAVRELSEKFDGENFEDCSFVDSSVGESHV